MTVMRLLYVADGRSPIALHWISYFIDKGHEVHLVSLYPCQPDLPLASLHIVPVAFSGAVGGGEGRRGLLRRLVPPRLRTALRQRFVPLTLPKAARQLSDIIQEVQPDLVHAMRIPYEGMLAALADPGPPLLISIWGNDFTLHAKSNSLTVLYTRHAVERADALHPDCQRDLRLAQEWGFLAERPAVVLPGGGGVKLDIFHPRREGTAPTRPTVINPRGMRAYVQNEAFFKAVPRVLERLPTARFLCPTLAGEAQVERWVAELGIEQAVELLPRQTGPQMADLFRQAQVAVSPTTHDGTPNTLLEAIACGCFPVAGDLESIREWITPGVNGLLVDAADPQALAEAMIRALEDETLRQKAAAHNTRLIAERAEYGQVMASAEKFYGELIGK